MPSLTKEVVKEVVSRYTASQVLSQREQLVQQIQALLTDHARKFDIILEDVSILDVRFGVDVPASAK